jgi:hypothetical protein
VGGGETGGFEAETGQEGVGFDDALQCGVTVWLRTAA